MPGTQGEHSTATSLPNAARSNASRAPRQRLCNFSCSHALRFVVHMSANSVGQQMDSATKSKTSSISAGLRSVVAASLLKSRAARDGHLARNVRYQKYGLPSAHCGIGMLASGVKAAVAASRLSSSRSHATARDASRAEAETDSCPAPDVDLPEAPSRVPDRVRSARSPR